MGTYGKKKPKFKPQVNYDVRKFKKLGWSYTKIAAGCKASKMFKGKKVIVTGRCWRRLWSKVQAEEVARS